MGLALAVVHASVEVKLNMNNVKGLVGTTNVMFLGKVGNLTACESKCLGFAESSCLSFTWHHIDFEKVQYQGHCYGHTDTYWQPVAQEKIDSGLRLSLPTPLPSPTPTPAPLRPCQSNADCAFAGKCTNTSEGGVCECRHPWTGPRCSALSLSPMDPSGGLRLPHNWTWGGSVILGEEDGLYHM